MAGESGSVHARAYLCDDRMSPDDAKRRLAKSNPGSIVQASRAGRVRNELFVEMLAAQTHRAKSTGGMLAEKPEIDFLLRLAGTTQISKAIKEWGAKKGEKALVVVSGESEVRGPPELLEFELPRRPLTAAELARVERAALLNALRA
jgi:tRNA threonylcarbamoyladenosine modification (KEOPS) complex Cgi121 subunit